MEPIQQPNYTNNNYNNNFNNNYNNNMNNQNYYANNQNNSKPKSYVAGLVLGILSILFEGLILGIIGIVVSAKNKKELAQRNEKNGKVTAGLVLSIIGLVKGIILIPVIILVVSLGILVYGNASETVSKANISSQSAQSQNSKFESYFGTDVTSTEVKNLLSEIRTNNLTATRNEESSVIGVVFVSKNATSNSFKGVYGSSTTLGNTDPDDITRSTFDNATFCSDIQSINNVLKPGTSYTVNVPNTKAYKGDQEGNTGFEADDVETGISGGYYSSGYIRLIYIVDNANRL